MSNLLEKLENLANEVANREGFKLYDIEFIQAQRKLIVTIDKKEGLNQNDGVSIDDCVNVSKGLNLLLDVEDLIPGEAYDLEVSSPGLERVLKKMWHFEGAIGKVAKVSIKADADVEAIGRLRAFKARIVEVNSESQVIVFNEIENSKLESIEVPFEIIHKAQLVFEYGRDIAKSKNIKKPKKIKKGK